MGPQTARDEAILDHVRRYHLTTSDVLKRAFFPETNDAAVRKVVSRLTRERRLRPISLFDNRKYYVLTAREAVARGEHRCIAQEFNYQGFVNAYGVLCFCMREGVEIFTVKEFEEKFPDLLLRGVRTRNYFIDRRGETNRLGFIHVDYGTNPERIARKVQRIIARGYTLPMFTKLIQGGRFVVAVLTSSVEKKTEIAQALAASPSPCAGIHLAVVPELRDVLLNRATLSHSRHRVPTGEAASPVASAEGQACPGDVGAEKPQAPTGASRKRDQS